MNEFIEKLIERLKEASNNPDRGVFNKIYLDDSILIINRLTEEYNNGWIPCEKELPKWPNTYLVTKMSEHDGNPIYETAHEIFWGSDGKWDCERDEDSEWKVIAWQNKIKPYQPKNSKTDC